MALAYAPASAKPAWAALLALDGKLAGAVRPVLEGAREPMLAQIRLAWWRERLSEPSAANPRGEPLLAMFAEWGEHRAGLVALVDGWEGLIGDAEAATAFAAARGAAAASLAQVLGAPGDASRPAGEAWGANDCAGLTGTALSLPPVPRLPRVMRPLPVLVALNRPGTPPLARLLVATRKGLFGL